MIKLIIRIKSGKVKLKNDGLKQSLKQIANVASVRSVWLVECTIGIHLTKKCIWH